jgi:energy-coupling factor transporter ATP-binding protein EcfA2
VLDAVNLRESSHRTLRYLSGGQRRRVAIARALAHRPNLVLADEPTAGLSAASGREALILLQKLAREQGSTSLIISSDDRVLDVADRIVHLESGRIANVEGQRHTVDSTVRQDRQSAAEPASSPPGHPGTVTRRPDEAFSSLTVIYRYPVPIALPYRRFHRQPDPTTRLQMLFAALEATLRYLVFLGLADLLACASSESALPALQSEAFEFLRTPRPMLLGKWAAALRELARALQEQPRPFVKELPLACGPQDPFFFQTVDRLIGLRNQVAHPEDGITADAEKSEELLRGARPDLEQVLQRVLFVTAYPLAFSQLRPGVPGLPGLHRYQLHSCMGTQPASTDAAYVVETTLSLPEQHPFVVAPDGKQVLCLWPFVSQRMAVASERHTLYLFQELPNRRAAYLSEIKSVAVDGSDHWRQVLREPPARDFDWLRSRLRELPSVQAVAPDLRLQDRLGHLHEGLLIGQRLGGYRLREVLGVGGFGTVYAAEPEETGSWVAVKVLENPQARRQVARFEREFSKLILAGSHPHVVRCLKVGRDIIEGREYPWYSMEFASGGDLAARIEERRPSGGSPPWDDPDARRDVVREFQAIASAVAHLHGLGILHRDIKPANVLILGDGTLRLSDFGLVKSLSPSEQSLLVDPSSSTGAVLGTRGYMAPEQALGQEVDTRADIYALGVLLAELATGQRPGSASLVGQGSPLNAWAPLAALPPSLRRFILRCTDRDPERRPPDGQAVADQFDQVLKQLDEPGE